MQTIIGLILLLSPFLIIYKFKDKKIGFAYILFSFLVFHLLIAIITQLLHIFTYPVILSINIIIFSAVLFGVNFYKPRPFLRNILSSIKIWDNTFLKFKKKIWKIDWLLIIVLFIASIYLSSVHFNYFGKYSIVTTPQYQNAKNMKYIYPYFADEWYAIALINDSIESHSLPLNNPLKNVNSPLANMEFTFHSFLAEIFLLLNLNPLTSYVILTIFSGLLICALIYFLLICSRVKKLPAAIAGLSVLYITNAANLPGLWTLIPLTMGIISLLLGFLFIAAGEKKAALATAIITLLFYPPLFIFYSIAIVLFFIYSKELTNKEKVKNIIYYFAFSISVVLILSFAYFLAQGQLRSFFPFIISKIFYTTLTNNFNPQFLIYNVIPPAILLLACFGIIKIIKRKVWLFYPLLLGLLVWFLYSSMKFRFIIEYPRLVVVTSILIVITAGFGLNYLFEILKKTDLFKQNKSLYYIQISLLVCFLLFSPHYTKRDNWQKLKAYNSKTNQFFMPAAPANQYLKQDDLEIFKDIHGQALLSFPWKSTVISIATGNFPATTKAGTITIKPNLFYRFMKLDCEKKLKIVKTNNIDLVYSPKLNCPNFEFIDKSNEKLYLYRLAD